MFYNHLKIAWRSLRKNKIYTFINVAGLAIGLAAALLIYRIVHYELSFNKNFAQYERIVRVVSEERSAEGEIYPSYCIPVAAMDVMKSTVSQFEAFSPVHELWSSITIPNPNGGPPLKKFGMEGAETAFFVYPDFFRIFDLEWLDGEPATAFNEPGTVVLSQSWATKCFERWEEAVGKTVLVDNLVPVTVKGVYRDLPTNCDFTYPYLISYATLRANKDLFFFDEGWNSCSTNNQVYALLQNTDQWDAANAVLVEVGKEEYKDGSDVTGRRHHLQVLSDLHYNEDYGHSGSHIISKSRLRILSAIGILILVMACFNFVNLATAQASLRAKEVGVRKTLGSRRSQLIAQFMSETGTIVFLSVMLGALLAGLCSPLLKRISDVPDELPFLSNPSVLAFLGLTAVVVTFLAGLYPSLALAGFKPVKALKNNADNSFIGGTALRKSLVVLQFVIAQGLIIGAIITILQLDYIRSRDLGFSQDLIYTFNYNTDSLTVNKQETLKRELLALPAVEKVSFSSDQPFSGNTWDTNFRYGSRTEDEPYGVSLKFCDADYAETYNMHLLAGNWMSPSDTMREAVVNQTLLEKLGILDPAEVIGQNIRLGSRRILKIVGVVKDFHTHSLREAHQPLLMTTRKEFYWEAGLKITPDNIAQTTTSIQQVYDRILPEQIFSGRFLDEQIAQFYEDDNRLSATCKGFGLLAILISCLGLFGLATHSAAQRVKEIGIRKVLGAGLTSIVALLSKDFLALVFIALILAIPLAWWLMNEWLNNFVFRIEMQYWVFLVTGVLALFIAFATVSFQAVRAALANPIKSLKSE
ncbi:MAG TPA: ABC transporter permease [Saprospiraceae bacterium]|nr:ABC transporter permease [Saprospiraceae bacterium]HMQ83340.1 ABC transporter permease [Saprospiraceae bacterium]